jgi:hypothetical protein
MRSDPGARRTSRSCTCDTRGGSDATRRAITGRAHVLIGHPQCESLLPYGNLVAMVVVTGWCVRLVVVLATATLLQYLTACTKDLSEISAAGSGSAASGPVQAVPVASRPPPMPSEPTPSAKTWQAFTQPDKMDDSQAVGVNLIADEEVTTRYGRAYRPRFWIGCQKNTTQAYFDLGSLLATETRAWESDEAYGYKSGTSLRLRLDKEPPISNFASSSTDGTAAFLSNPITLLKKMVGHTTLIVEYSPMGSSPQTVSFTITGMAEAIAVLRKTCHW